MEDRRATAYHEAGHAVAAWWLGLRFRGVSIRPDDESEGRLTWHTLPARFQPDVNLTPRGEQLLGQRTVVSLAGGIAQEIATGTPWDECGVGGDVQNTVTFGLYASGGDDQECELYCDLMAHRARRIIRRQWAAVEAVAQALLEREQLTEDEVLAVALDAR